MPEKNHWFGTNKPPATIEEYVARLTGEKREWLETFTGFMRDNHPEIKGAISYQMPMYRFGNKYIAFSAAKNYFSLHCLEFAMIAELPGKLPKGTAFGKGCAKVAYKSREAIPVLFDFCNKVIERGGGHDSR